jgi:hypothetical protein
MRRCFATLRNIFGRLPILKLLLLLLLLLPSECCPSESGITDRGRF